jgi:hypothetical protein
VPRGAMSMSAAGVPRARRSAFAMGDTETTVRKGRTVRKPRCRPENAAFCGPLRPVGVFLRPVCGSWRAAAQRRLRAGCRALPRRAVQRIGRAAVSRETVGD